MKNFFKGKFGTIVIILATVILAGVAVFTAIRLYQLRSQPVAPNVPSSMPEAATTNVGRCSALAFSLNTGSPTPTPSETTTPTPTSTPTPTTTPNSCNGTCQTNAGCAAGLTCFNGSCRNPLCTGNANCVCGTSAPTSTPPTLPQSGTDWPTLVSAGFGIITIIGSILLAL